MKGVNQAMQQQQVSANQPTQFRNYSRNALLTLDIIGVAIMIVFLIALSISFATTNASSTYDSMSAFVGMSTMLLYAEIIAIFVLDGQGAARLRGAAKGYIESQGKIVSTRGLYITLYILFPYIMLPIYLVRTSLDYRKDYHNLKQQEEQQQKHKIATLEAELGILPPTEGMCRVCKKPLVVGADFCQYCGATAIEHPKICPSCATTASPDAKWCPKCRTALT